MSQRAMERRARDHSDHEFLPAALEITEKPPSFGFRFLMLALCALFAIATLWSILGRVDVVATASGKVIPSGNVKLIQPIEIGSVRAIYVRNGQHVRAGELLVELDPTLAGADEAAAAQNLQSYRVVSARNAALLDHLKGRSARFSAPVDTPTKVAGVQDEFVRSSIDEYEGERLSLVEQRAEQRAMLDGAEAEIAKLTLTLPLIDRQMAARADLTKRGFYSRLKLLEYEQLRVEHIQNIAVQRANAAKARAAIGNLDGQLQRLRGTFAKTAVGALSEAEEKSGLAREEVTKSARRRQFQQLRSPVAGTVQQVGVSTIGGVVQPAQILMIVVPDDTAMVIEANVLNRDIGFVAVGQPVRIKLEAFNFTDYGVVPGVVDSISRDAVELPAERGAREAGGLTRPVGGSLVYVARIRFDRRTIRVGGQDQPIGPGLAAQVEIVTGQRRIIQYLLSPLARVADEAGRER